MKRPTPKYRQGQVLDFHKDIDWDYEKGKEQSSSQKDIYNSGGLIAPNGKKSNLNEIQYKLVRTPAFKKWFGDWENDAENASKVVDSNGEPLVVYHGTNKKINIFDTKKIHIGSNTTSDGFFFSTNKEYIKKFGNKHLECFLKIKTPIIIDEKGKSKILNKNEIDKVISKRIKDKNVDEDFLFDSKGFLNIIYGKEKKVQTSYGQLLYAFKYIFKNDYEDYANTLFRETKIDGFFRQNTFICLFPNQIKLADGSNITFDGSNPDIRFDKGGTTMRKPKKFYDGGGVEYNSKFMKRPSPKYRQGQVLDLKGYGKVKILDLAWLVPPITKRPQYIYDFILNHEGKITKFKRNDFSLYEYEVDMMLADVDTGIDYEKSYKKYLGSGLRATGNPPLEYVNFIKVINGSLYYKNHPEFELNPPVKNFYEAYAEFTFGGTVKWYEHQIDDSVYEWKIDMKDCYNLYKSNKKISVNQVVKHDLLFSKYPSIKSIKIVFGNILDKENDSDSYVSFKDNFIDSEIFINLDFDYYEQHGKEKYNLKSDYPELSKESVLLHEIQHLTQREDGKQHGRSFESILEEVNKFRSEHSGDSSKYGEIALSIYKRQPSEQEAMKTVFLWLKSKGLKYHFHKDIDWDYEKGKEQSSSQKDIYNSGGLIAPNGKKSNLNEIQYKLVRTPAFKKWFGDWENSPETASKVVDENGEPLICFHASNTSFNIFDVDKQGNNYYGNGIYFSNDKKDVKQYGKKIITVFLSIKKPFILNNKTKKLVDKYADTNNYLEKDLEQFSKYTIGYRAENPNLFQQNIKKDGYDGLFIDDSEYTKNTFISYYPEKIKLADGSNTTFDGSNPDIRFGDGGNLNNPYAIYDDKKFVKQIEESIEKDGSSFICSYVASAIRMLEGKKVKIYGFSQKENPQALYFKELDEDEDEGHHFAVADDRYIIDAWIFNNFHGKSIFGRSVFDLKNPNDKKIIEYVYGKKSNWTDITNQSDDFEKLFHKTSNKLKQEYKKFSSKNNKLLYGGKISANKYYEIDDSLYSWRYNQIALYSLYKSDVACELEYLIDHPVLFEKYKGIGQVKVWFFDGEENKAEVVFPKTLDVVNNFDQCEIKITLNFKYYAENRKEFKTFDSNEPDLARESILLHEIQHILQAVHNRPAGTSHAETSKRANARINALRTNEKAKRITPEEQSELDFYNTLSEKSFHDFFYYNDDGELEARKVVRIWLKGKGIRYVDPLTEEFGIPVYDDEIKPNESNDTNFDGSNPDIRFGGGGEIKIGDNVFKIKVYLGDHSYDRETDKETPMWFTKVYQMNGKSVEGILTEDDDLEGSDIGNFDSQKKAKDFIRKYGHKLNVILLDDNGDKVELFSNPDIRYVKGGLVSSFNEEMKNEMSILKEDVQNDLRLINETVAMRFINYLAKNIGEVPYEVDFVNREKNPTNLFQMQCYTHSGNIIWATFVYVDDNHKVIKSKSNIELLDSDYNTLKKLEDGGDIRFDDGGVIVKHDGSHYETKDGKAYADVDKNKDRWHISMIESKVKGGGTSIINRIIQDAKKNGVKKITLTTTEFSGWGFFDKLGFKEVGDNNDPHDIPMELILGSNPDIRFYKGGQTKNTTMKKPTQRGRLTAKEVKEKSEMISNKINEIKKQLKWHEGKEVAYPLTENEKKMLNDGLGEIRKERERIWAIYLDMKDNKKGTISNDKAEIKLLSAVIGYAVRLLDAKYIINYLRLNKKNRLDGKFYSSMDIQHEEKRIQEFSSKLGEKTGDYTDYINLMKIKAKEREDRFSTPQVVLQYNDPSSLVITDLSDYLGGAVTKYDGAKVVYSTAPFEIPKVKIEIDVEIEPIAKQAIKELISVNKYSRLTEEEGEYLYAKFKDYESLIDEYGEYVAKVSEPIGDEKKKEEFNEFMEMLGQKQYIYYSGYDETIEAYQITIDFINSVRGRIATLEAKQSGTDLFPELEPNKEPSKKDITDAIESLKTLQELDPDNKQVKEAIDSMETLLETLSYELGGQIKYYEVQKEGRPVLKAKFNKTDEANISATSKMLDDLADRGYKLNEVTEEQYRKFDYSKISPEDLAEFTKGAEYLSKGGKIEFDKDKVPSTVIYNYAIKLKKQHPKIWMLGGNQFGNQAFKNLEKVIKRGYWLDSEKWMFIKWQGYLKRHAHDYQINGVVASLKWIGTVDKGWDYMKETIENEIKGKSDKFDEGGETTKSDKNTTIVEARTEHGLEFDFDVSKDLNLDEVMNLAKEKCSPQTLKWFKFKGIKYTVEAV